MSRRTRGTLVLGLLGALVGCQKQHKDGGPPPNPNPTASASPTASSGPTPSTSPSATPVADVELRPFTLEYRSISRAQTCRGNTRTRIESDGRVFTATNTANCTGGSPWSTPYPAQPARTLSASELDALARTVLGSGFFDLPARYSTPGRASMGGRDEELEITVGQRKHLAVMEQNSSQPAFTTVRQAVVDASFVP